MFCVVIFLFVELAFLSSAERPCRTDELPCDDRSCVGRHQWCNDRTDCWDRSDEIYCTGEPICLEDLHFSCDNGKCVPLSAECDGHDDCRDGSDEDYCERHEDFGVDISPEVKSSSLPESKEAVAKAIEFLRRKNFKYSWNDFTPRAAIAFSFASKASIVEEKEMELIRSKLDIKFLLTRMEKQLRTSSLALYINALYATCQDPRNYEGIDLVHELLQDTMMAMKSNSSVPISFLTLCIADETIPGGNVELARLYDSQEFRKTTSRALLVMTMICLSNKFKNNLFEKYLMHYFSTDMRVSEKADVYTLALLTQVAIASRSNVNFEWLLNKQLEDGSFGDMLATYYAIPALLNLSFLDLRCNTTQIGKRRGNLIMPNVELNHAIVSIWTSTGKEANSDSLTLTFDSDKSLYNIMLMASDRDHRFRFSFEETDQGKQVFSINGVHNDIEYGTAWMVYSGTVGEVTINSMKNLHLIKEGIDWTEVQNNTHYVFWYRRV